MSFNISVLALINNKKEPEEIFNELGLDLVKKNQLVDIDELASFGSTCVGVTSINNVMFLLDLCGFGSSNKLDSFLDNLPKETEAYLFQICEHLNAFSYQYFLNGTHLSGAGYGNKEHEFQFQDKENLTKIEDAATNYKAGEDKVLAMIEALGLDLMGPNCPQFDEYCY